MKEDGEQFRTAKVMKGMTIWEWVKCRLLLLNQDLMCVCVCEKESATELTSSCHAVPDVWKWRKTL